MFYSKPITGSANCHRKVRWKDETKNLEKNSTLGKTGEFLVNFEMNVGKYLVCKFCSFFRLNECVCI